MSDPYIRLLGIRDMRRPVNAYQLIGVPDRENDNERIKRAAKSRKSTLIQKQKQTSPIEWQKMMDELEKAIKTLTDEEKKVVYDESLDHGNGDKKSNGAAKNSSVGPMPTPLLGVTAATCTNCGATNLPGRKFCGSCGQTFFEPCIECKCQTMVGERFCGNCGVNLEEVCEKRRQHAEVQLRRIKQLSDEARYQEAIGLVSPIAELESGRLSDIIDQARLLLDEIRSLRDTSKSRVDDNFNNARAAMDQSRWQDAVDALESIPELLRNSEHKALLLEAKEAAEELDFLNTEIRAAIKSDRLVGLLSKVERVIALSPSDERMKKLAGKLRRRKWHDERQEGLRLRSEARRLRKEFQYQEAYELLVNAPPEVVDEEFEQLQSQLEESAYLWSTLRHSPLADARLLELGERLQKLAPGDAKLGTILTQLRQRLSKNKAPCDVVPWAKPPADTAMGCPVNRLTTYGKIDISDMASQPVFTDAPSRFFAATGAALQGLGKATIATNLIPKTGKGILGAFSRRNRTGESAWGIDITGSAIKGVRLVIDSKSNVAKMTAFDVVEHESGLSDFSSEAQRRDLLGESLGRFIERNAIKDEVICATISGALVLGRFFALPPVEIKRLGDMMQYEARQQVPFPLEQLSWDHHINYEEDDGTKIPTDAMLLAAKQHNVVQHLDIYEEHKVRPHILQCDCVALFNFYRAAFVPDNKETASPTVALLDVGSDNTNFIICKDDGVWFRSMPRGGDDLNRALMRKFEASFAVAEQLKRRPAKSKRISSLHSTWEPIFESLAKDTRDSIAAYQSAHRNQLIEELLICGGGSKVLGFHRHLLGA